MENKPFPIYQLMDAFEAFSAGEADVKPQHRSLYYFLIGYARRRGNVPRYNMPYENGMHGCGIGSWATYDAALKKLAEWGFIVYTPGANRFKVPVIELTFRNPTDDVLLIYWQSYCLSTSNPTDDVLLTQLATYKDLLEDRRKEVEEIGHKNTQLQADKAAADAALELAGKKIQELSRHLVQAQQRPEDSSLPANNAQASHTKGARRPGRDEPADFVVFYEAYPKQEKRKEALAAWLKLKPEEQENAYQLACNWFAARPDLAQPERYQYIPAPATWLNNKRWTDTPPPLTTHHHVNGTRTTEQSGHPAAHANGRLNVEEAVGIAGNIAVGLDTARRTGAPIGSHDAGAPGYSAPRPPALSYPGG